MIRLVWVGTGLLIVSTVVVGWGNYLASGSWQVAALALRCLGTTQTLHIARGIVGTVECG